MTFFTTFEHAVAKAIEKLKSLGAGELPKVQAAVAAVQKGIPTVEAVATVVDPAAAAVITAVGNAGSALLAKAVVALNDESTMQNAMSTGTLTLGMAADEIADVKALAPTVLGVVQAIGLGHTIPPAAAKAA